MTDQKLAWVREAAGDRYADIEITLLIFMATLTDDREGTLANVAPLFAMDPEGLAEYPHAWIGTVDQIVESLEAGRERWDASYLVIQGADSMRAMAPVVARLAGS